MKEFVKPEIQAEYDRLLWEEEDLNDQLETIKQRIEEIETNEEQE